MDFGNYQAEIIGVGASGGRTRGIVKIIEDADDLEKIEEGDILVAPTITPDYMPALRKVNAVVLDKGELKGHSVIICKDMGLPTIIKTQNGSSLLRDGDVIEVDGARGIVLKI